MLSAKLEKALNTQISEENYASNYYLAMASWCEKVGLVGTARFMYQHAETERVHMMKLFRYVNNTGGHARVLTAKEPPHEFKSLPSVLELTLKHERAISKRINDLVDQCLDEKDYSTFNFLQWYVAEQHEEEHLFRTLLNLVKITGLEGRGLFLVDKEIGGYADRAKKPA